MMHCVPEQHRQPAWNVAIPIATGGVFAALAASVPSPWLLPAYLAFGAAMVTLTITDVQTKLIPNRILGPATVVGSVLLTAGGLLTTEYSSIVRAAAGGFAYFGVMLALALIARGALGFGDVKMAFMIGVFTGYLGWGNVVVAGLGAFVLGGLVSLILLVTRLRSRKDMIPFGPFMTTAGIGAIIFAEAITDWYVAG
jgi:leader peptidase (prepilin peptidase)/N-methyltransferase